MGPIKNPCCGEAKRRERGAGGGKKKGKRRIDVRDERASEVEEEGEREDERGEKRASRPRRVACPFSLFFKTRDTLFRTLSIGLIDLSGSRINSRSILGRELRSKTKNKNAPIIRLSSRNAGKTRSTNFCGLPGEPRSHSDDFYWHDRHLAVIRGASYTRMP